MRIILFKYSVPSRHDIEMQKNLRISELLPPEFSYSFSNGFILKRIGEDG